jgi:hypothetical protein
LASIGEKRADGTRTEPTAQSRKYVRPLVATTTSRPCGQQDHAPVRRDLAVSCHGLISLKANVNVEEPIIQYVTPTRRLQSEFQIVLIDGEKPRRTLQLLPFLKGHR